MSPPSSPISVSSEPTDDSILDPESEIGDSRRIRRRWRVIRSNDSEINNAGRRAYYQQRFERIEAEMAAEEALSLEVRIEKQIHLQAKSLVKHLQPQCRRNMSGTDIYLTHLPKIMVQRAPWSIRGAACKLWVCEDKIKPDSYRIALRPGMGNWSRGPGEIEINSLSYVC
jgi:hypothetical protein